MIFGAVSICFSIFFIIIGKFHEDYRIVWYIIGMVIALIALLIYFSLAYLLPYYTLKIMEAKEEEEDD